MLALQFGEPKIKRLKKLLTPGEFLEWKTFYELRPFGDEWEDFRTAWIAWNIPSFSDSKRTFDQFMPPIAGRKFAPKPVQSEESFNLEMMKIRRAMGNV